jgi:pimeloyl-ACP methyl ester carboxylesterase
LNEGQDTARVGVSMGGTTALALAGMHPRRVNRLVVLNAGPSTDLPALEQMLTDLAAKAREVNGPLNILADLWPMSVNERFAASDEGLRTRQHWNAVNAVVQGRGLAHIMEGVKGFDGSELLSRIEARSLFVAGSEDPAATHVRHLPNEVPGSTYAEIAGARHIANVDEADAFTAELLRFLA